MKREETEQIDELSVDALERYKRKAGEQVKQSTDATATHDRTPKVGKERLVAKRIAGRNLATHKQVQQMYKETNEEEVEIEEGQSHQARTTMKHIINPTSGEKKAAKDIKPGIAGYRDRVAMLKSAEARGALKKESIFMKSFNQFIAEADMKVHPNAIHVSDAGAGKYKVHAVGSNHSDRIKVGEHLTDTELDDFSEVGGKIKHVKPKE